MKNRNDIGPVFKNIMWVALGAFVGAVVTLFSADDHSVAAVVFGGCGFVLLISLLAFIWTDVVIPRRSKRNAALRALGKDGIKLVRKDEIARLAYKGIYSLLDGKLPQAEEYLQQALSHTDMRQNQMFCIEWLIRLYEAMENDSKLMWCYRKAVEYAPDNPEAQSRLGHSYFSEGKLDRAEYCFEQALRYDPNHGYSYFSLAKIQMVRGEDKKAFDTLQQLVKINENHPLCHAELADWYAMQGDAEHAEEECRKAQLCGIREPDELNKRINAMLGFHKADYDGKNLPEIFYRKIEPKTSTDGKESAND